jgi:hypothetical protein
MVLGPVDEHPARASDAKATVAAARVRGPLADVPPTPFLLIESIADQ